MSEYESPTFDELACELLGIVDDLRSDDEVVAEAKETGQMTGSGLTMGLPRWNWETDELICYPGGLTFHDNERLHSLRHKVDSSGL